MRIVPCSTICFSAFVAVSLFARADDFGAAQPFKDGDTVCFVGDSITNGGLYHADVMLYYATRFPDRKIASWNCGIGGDRANGIVSDENYRLNVDILGHKPTVATIMLGMNDIGHTDYYAPGKDAPDVAQKRARSLEVYDESMRKLIGALQKSGARLILITPSPYDETTKLPTARPEVAAGADAALGKCAEKVHAWAKQYGAGIVNFHEVMDAIDAREQAKDPAFTIVGADRVHPGAVGHFVMAYTFLKAQGVPREVATIAIDGKKGKAGTASNCTIGDVKAGPTNVNFDCTEKALPMVPPDEAKAALALVPFEKELNEEKLVVTGLAAGNYELKIDEMPVGEYTAADLAAGVNLAENAKTPQYVQSAAATKISKERFGVGLKLRAIAAQLYPLSRSKVDVSDASAVEAAMNKRLASAKPPEDARIKAGLEAFQQREKLAKDYDALGVALHDACQPKSHHFTLVKK